MNQKLTFAIIFLLVSYLAFAQTKIGFCVNGGLIIPSGDLSEIQKLGFNGGAMVRIPLSSSSIDVAFGAAYAKFSGKTEAISGFSFTQTFKYESADLITIFFGAQINTDEGQGFYFLPAITANFDEVESRFGADLGAGYMLALGSGNTKFDLSVKFSFTNLIGKEDGEGSANLIRILAGAAF